jgi:hypothetical protein
MKLIHEVDNYESFMKSSGLKGLKSVEEREAVEKHAEKFFKR